MSLEMAVRNALTGHDIQPVDAGAVELALTYARDIDGGSDLTKLGPALLACLDALLLTPRARKAVAKGVSSASQPANRMDELRERRLRKGRAEDLDTAAT